MCFVLDDKATLTFISPKGCKSSLSDGLHPFFVFQRRGQGSAVVSGRLLSIFVCESDVHCRFEGDNRLKMSPFFVRKMHNL